MMPRHGERSCYAAGCRRAECRAANTRYQKARRTRTDPALVPAGPARDHLAFLAGRGVGSRTIAAAAKVNRTTVQAIASGRRTHVHATIAGRILAVPAIPVRYVDATRTWQLIEGMLAAGIPQIRIARALGYVGNGIPLHRTVVLTRNAARVELLARRHAPHVWAKVMGERTGDIEAATERQRALRRRHRDTAA